MALPGIKLKLIHKGLLLVSVPLAFGVIFVLIFQTYLQDVRLQRSHAVFGMNLSRASHRLVADLLEEQAQLSGLASSHEKASLSAFNQAELNTQKDVQALQALIDKYAGYAEELTALQNESLAKSRETLKQVAAARSLMDRTEATLATGAPENEQSAQTRTKALFSAVQQLNENGRVALETGWLDSSATKKFDQAMHRLLAYGLALNVVLCPLIVLYFSQNFVSRLAVLIANSDRFARGQDLLPPVGGSDEIAKLDGVFRQMSHSVRASEEAKKEFVQMISHDLRTPLNSVQATLTLLAEGIYGKLSSDGLAKVRSAEQAAGELISLTNDLLELDKLESGKLPLQQSAVSVQTLIKRTKDSVDGFAQYKHVSIESDSTDLFVTGDEERLLHVLINLVANAVKFSPDGTAVVITLLESSTDMVEVRVTDSGRGVPASQRDSIFDRFSQIERADHAELGGSGLGLAICKAIVLQHNGSIGVDENASGCGSTFWIRLRQCKQPRSQLIVRQNVS